MAKESSYFVCTLGQAKEAKIGKSPSFPSVNVLIDTQASRIPDHPAVAFQRPVKQDRDGSRSTGEPLPAYDIFTFEDLRRGSTALAARFVSSELGQFLKPQHTVALLAQSTPVFLFTWLALMRTGAAVLLIAPQCQPEAIAHLCHSCETKCLIYDPAHADLCRKTVSIDGTIIASEIPLPWEDLSKELLETPEVQFDFPREDELHVAYLHHTSGTSSGLPKPIPQTHRAAVGVLPELDGSSSATFTTTPLYHGGIADCFRSWTSNALIWLFPGSIPITSKNILISLDTAKQLSQKHILPPVKYFSSVPYVLQMLAADTEGLDYLRAMDMVGVGGAALPDEIGDDFVEKGVPLLSRFGSAECGFLLSSHRDFSTDKAWQYLRPNTSKPLLKFEPREDNLAELVVSHEWAHLAKQNRDDGSYATADLFAPHPSIPNAWRYHSRADSQLNLITGKKFDPAPLEDSIAAGSLLTDVLIFGNGKQYPGALLWRSDKAADMSANEVLTIVWPDIEKLNNETQSHARLPRSMLVILPPGTERPEKSSKGTLLRKPIEKRFEEIMEKAYDRNETADEIALTKQSPLGDGDIATFIQDVIRQITGRNEDIPQNMDLFGNGIDSVACIRIRKAIERQFGQSASEPLPINIVYDCGTIAKLAGYIVAYRKGEMLKEEDELSLMNQLVDKWASFDDRSSAVRDKAYEDGSRTTRTYLLTGATGALGAHILDQLLSRSEASDVVCLVRGADEHASIERVSKSLQYRKLQSISGGEKNVTCIPSRFGDPNLGLSQSKYLELAKKIDVIIHAAWAVNFSTRLRSFEQDHIRGIHNLINLALSAPEGNKAPHFIFCSSTASVIASESKRGNIAENISQSASDASSLGYSRSKWVAEAVCARAAPLLAKSHGRISVARVGQLCGDTHNGIWNMSEAWPLMLSASRCLGEIPDLGPEPLNWLPVDLAAEALLQIADEQSEKAPGVESARVYHVLRQSQDHKPNWNDVIQWVKSEMGPEPMWVVPLSTWVKKLQGLDKPHPAQKLAGLWKSRADGNEGGKFDVEMDAVWFDQFETVRTCPKLNSDGQMSQPMFSKLWSWISQEDK